MANVFCFELRELEPLEFSEQENLDLTATHVMHPTDGSLCGIQTDGEGGIVISDIFEGKVTCPECFKIIEAVQKIKSWK